jgi:hypothetical protein
MKQIDNKVMADALARYIAKDDVVEEFATNLAYEGDDKFLVDDEARLDAILNEELG